MNGIGKDDDVGIGYGIDPKRSASETGVSEGADGKQLSAIAGEGRIDVPSQSAEARGVGGLLRSGHLLNRQPAQDFVAMQQRLRKLGQDRRRWRTGLHVRRLRPSVAPLDRGRRRAASFPARRIAWARYVASNWSGGRKVVSVMPSGAKIFACCIFIQRHARDFLYKETERLKVDVAIEESCAGSVVRFHLHCHIESSGAAFPRLFQDPGQEEGRRSASSVRER